jgi:hypothetical protein
VALGMCSLSIIHGDADDAAGAGLMRRRESSVG